MKSRTMHLWIIGLGAAAAALVWMGCAISGPEPGASALSAAGSVCETGVWGQIVAYDCTAEPGYETPRSTSDCGGCGVACGTGEACNGSGQCVCGERASTIGGGTACGAGQICDGGVCRTPGAACGTDGDCGAGESCCGGECVDTTTDLAHCGGCGITCELTNAIETCIAGSCAIETCTLSNFGSPLYYDCAGDGAGCGTARSTSNCGGCGVVCGAGETCNGMGACRCGSTEGTTGSGAACAAGMRCAGGACVPDASLCGNGVIDAGEACDDGNAVGGDGCTADCALTEAGFTCTGTPSLCCLGSPPGGFALVGDAYLNGATGAVHLTDDFAHEVGAAWITGAFDLSAPFDLRFYARFGSADGGGEGMAVVLQRRSLAEIGWYGDSLGALNGVDAPYLGVAFDTHQDQGEVGADHLAFFGSEGLPEDQTECPVCIERGCANVEDGAMRLVELSWDPTTTTLEVWVGGKLRRSLVRDLITLDFGGDPSGIIVGFTGATSANTTSTVHSAQAICLQGIADICRSDSDCGVGESCCMGACVDMATDTNHCGACGNVCSLPNADAACVAGACEVASCTLSSYGWPLYFDCSGDGPGCGTPRGTDNCGGCGIVCGAGERCNGSSQCVCGSTQSRPGAGAACGAGQTCVADTCTP